VCRIEDRDDGGEASPDAGTPSQTTHRLGVWSNGMTSDSDSLSGGSIPSTPT
jgi:hypothetical protein